LRELPSLEKPSVGVVFHGEGQPAPADELGLAVPRLGPRNAARKLAVGTFQEGHPLRLVRQAPGLEPSARHAAATAAHSDTVRFVYPGSVGFRTLLASRDHRYAGRDEHDYINEMYSANEIFVTSDLRFMDWVLHTHGTRHAGLVFLPYADTEFRAGFAAVTAGWMWGSTDHSPFAMRGKSSTGREPGSTNSTARAGSRSPCRLIWFSGGLTSRLVRVHALGPFESLLRHPSPVLSTQSLSQPPNRRRRGKKGG
jgi:hypothetical protein